MAKIAFGHLVVDREMKELIHALITNKTTSENGTGKSIHTVNSEPTPDSHLRGRIRAKGNGLIMLLHGGPGTSKLFTAESAAELAKKPLYTITRGDIGTRPRMSRTNSS
jgi:hypothetical protein